MTSPARIDTHQHLIPPAYRKLLDERGLTAGGWPTPPWDPQAAIDMMDRESIAIGILSLSAPGVHLAGDEEGRTLARQVNEYHAELVKRRPDRFGQFACIPLPDVEGAVTEAVYALDELHADGVVLLSNAAGKYLGDPDFEPLWAELDARSAVVFIHPTEPPIQMLKGLPSPLLDYPFDTTRTAVHMVANGVMSRHTRIKVILSHGGGFLPYAAYRFTGAAQFNPGVTPEGIMTDMKRFYFDTALSSTPTALPSLLAFADPTHITFGSDFPFAPSSHQFNAALDAWPLDEKLRYAINRGNAEKLFPRLAATA
ncbi:MULTISPECIES: amidohydrolase family protein [Burkholderiaceae]|uniref:amidohydrolase family protein n=1 Tax=Burkholderiaceae TaxID=119060 RepID=UPI000E8094D8|nr:MULTISPECIES: amidohydrolase family protein [Burkholderiaceae]HBD33941.1 amidohydrolase [Cupriavidus sp.]KAB0600188.1 amidohydrolase [Cupriavidus pauculus]MCA7943012.1 amidohydrolase [Burkholderia vietnamiensis]MCA8148833.1 amidohydrolase [Burkholderia vietnamiensis]MCA8193864.1 amidohydrolase [Burkholderia vietnamiensis]